MYLLERVYCTLYNTDANLSLPSGHKFRNPCSRQHDPPISSHTHSSSTTTYYYGKRVHIDREMRRFFIWERERLVNICRRCHTLAGRQKLSLLRKANVLKILFIQDTPTMWHECVICKFFDVQDSHIVLNAGVTLGCSSNCLLAEWKCLMQSHPHMCRGAIVYL